MQLPAAFNVRATNAVAAVQEATISTHSGAPMWFFEGMNIITANAQLFDNVVCWHGLLSMNALRQLLLYQPATVLVNQHYAAGDAA
jgi:hypothetical protein